MFPKVALVSLCTLVATRRVAQEEGPDGKDVLKELCEKKLAKLIFCDSPAPKLHFATSGQMSFHVKVQNTGNMETLNLFLAPKKDGFMTLRDYESAEGKQKDIADKARRECRILQKFQEERVDIIGARNLMKCLDMNFGSTGDLSMPAYTITDYQGGTSLDLFMRRAMQSDPKGAARALRKIFRQILQGVRLMSNHEPTLIHHNLKPSDILVTSNISTGLFDPPDHSVQIVGFSSVTLGTEDNLCKLTPVDLSYAPAEWGHVTDRCPEGENFRLEHADKFDMYSVGMIWIELITGRKGPEIMQEALNTWCGILGDQCSNGGEAKDLQLPSDMPTALKRLANPEWCTNDKKVCEKLKVVRPNGELDHEVVGYLASQKDTFIWLLKTAMRKRNDSAMHGGSAVGLNKIWTKLGIRGSKSPSKMLERLMGDERALSFMEQILRTLSSDPADRPSASHLLAHRWMSGDPDPPQEVKQAELEMPCNLYFGQLIHCFNPQPILLASGGYAQAWLVEAKDSNRKEVMKLYFAPNEDRYLTVRDHLYPTDDTKDEVITLIREVEKECAVLQQLHKAFPNAAGARHVVQCYGLDFGLGYEDYNLNMPLVTLMEYVGDREWSDFSFDMMEEDPEKAVGILREVFKQVLKGVSLLANHNPVIVHHDLKPDNIMVSTATGNDGDEYYSATIIDFGAVARATKDEVCTITPGSVDYSPNDWFLPGAYCEDGANFDLEYPGAFDVFNLAMTWVATVTTMQPRTLMMKVHRRWCRRVSDVWCSREEYPSDVPRQFQHKMTDEECEKEKEICNSEVFFEEDEQFNYGVLAHLTSAKLSFMPREIAVISAMNAVVKETKHKETGAAFLHELLKGKKAVSFLAFMLGTMKDLPQDRPSAEQMLNHPWMTGQDEGYNGDMTEWDWTVQI